MHHATEQEDLLPPPPICIFPYHWFFSWWCANIEVSLSNSFGYWMQFNCFITAFFPAFFSLSLSLDRLPEEWGHATSHAWGSRGLVAGLLRASSSIPTRVLICSDCNTNSLSPGVTNLFSFHDTWKGIYSIVVESPPGLASEVQPVLYQRNSWRANLPHFQTASLLRRQETPPCLWPLSLKLTVLSTACVLDCSCKCWLCWLYASFSMARLFFHLLNYYKAQAEWQWHGSNHRKRVRFPASSHKAALGFWGQELSVTSIKMTTKGKKN